MAQVGLSPKHKLSLTIFWNNLLINIKKIYTNKFLAKVHSTARWRVVAFTMKGRCYECKNHTPKSLIFLLTMYRTKTYCTSFAVNLVMINNIYKKIYINSPGHYNFGIRCVIITLLARLDERRRKLPRLQVVAFTNKRNWLELQTTLSHRLKNVLTTNFLKVLFWK